MHRFHLPPEQCRDSLLRLTDREAHHAAQVLRLQPTDRVTVLDGAGNELLCETNTVTRRDVQLQVVQRIFHPPLPFRLTLLQAIPKGKVFDLIVQKATELGVHRVVPLLTERVVVRLDPRDAAQKVEKWRQIAIESIKQCGSPWLPQIESPITPAQFAVKGERRDLALVAALCGPRAHPREVLQAFHLEHQRRPASVDVWIGPEGDFTETELAAITAGGAQAITLGPNVLRADTAAIYCMSVLSYESHTP